MITKEQVFEALTTFSSAEGDAASGGVVYYLHISKSGEILGTAASADATFTYEINDEDAYFGSTKAAEKQKAIDEMHERIFEAEQRGDFEAVQEAQQELKAASFDEYCMEDYYSKERRDDADFMKIVENLANQANEYIERQK